jgi:hypothetical protein
MSSYKITPYSYKRAASLGVTIKPSRYSTKKIDVYDRTGNYIVSVGAFGYKDYPTYMKENGKEYADKRRLLYKQRHEKDRHVKGSAGYYADQILW